MKQWHVDVNAANGDVSGELIVEGNSGNSGDGARDKRMKKEIFETDKYLGIRFNLTKLKGAQPLKDEASLRIVGQFIIQGITRTEHSDASSASTGRSLAARGNS